MRLAVSLGFLAPGVAPDDLAVLARDAEQLGYSDVWVPEAYGSDAATVLAWLAARTERIGLGSAVFQIPGRSPAMTAMTAATLDTVSGGRFRLGLGVSGPQVSEGWHGVPFAHPLARTREYIGIVRLGVGRKVVQSAGPHYPLPLPDGPGKALRLSFRPVRDTVPVYLAAVGPRNLELAGEVADGWLAVFLAPEHAREALASVAAGRARAGRTLDGFDVVASVPVVFGDDVAACADRARAHAALYLGGMGSREQNFYNGLAVRMGFGDEAREVQELYLAGRLRDAAAAVPLEFLDRTALLGPVERVAGRLRAYAEAGVTELSALCFGDTAGRARELRLLREAYDRSGVGE